MQNVNKLWIKRIYEKCSGCRRCEITCSLHHEGKIWPEASRVRIFMLVPGVEIPHLCFQCNDYPCVEECPEEALSVDDQTRAVITDKSKCTACGICINACPGRVPHLHPQNDYIVICDLCGGKPKCTTICQEGKWDTLILLESHMWKWKTSQLKHLRNSHMKLQEKFWVKKQLKRCMNGE